MIKTGGKIKINIMNIGIANINLLGLHIVLVGQATIMLLERKYVMFHKLDKYKFKPSVVLYLDCQHRTGSTPFIMQIVQYTQYSTS